MKQFFSTVKLVMFWISISVIMVCWGLENEGYIRIFLGIVFFIVAVESAVKEISSYLELRKWFIENHGKLILFYPTKKKIQMHIKSEFVPKIPFEILEVYYEGSKLVGDINPSVLRQLMRCNSDLYVHNPLMLKVGNNSFEKISLNELLIIKETNIDFESLICRIEKLKR